MKNTIRAIALLMGLLMMISWTLVGCKQDQGNEENTTAETTDTTETTVSGNEEDTATDTEPETQATSKPSAPVEMTRDEVMAILNTNTDLTSGTITTRTRVNGELTGTVELAISDSRLSYIAYDSTMRQTITILGDKVYYIYEVDGIKDAYVVNVDENQATTLAGMLWEDVFGTTSASEDEDTTEAIMEADWKGVRYHDGTEVISADLGRFLMEKMMGAYQEGMTMTAEMTLSAEGLITAMKYIVTLPAGVMGDEAYTISIMLSIDYTAPAIDVPESDYFFEATYDDLFGGEPEFDPEEAAFYGLDPEGDNYVIGLPSEDYTIEDQYWFFSTYYPYYEGKNFILYGQLDQYAGGAYYVLMEDTMYWIYFSEDMEIPANGTQVCVTATFSIVEVEEDGESYVDYYMVVTSIQPQ